MVLYTLDTPGQPSTVAGLGGQPEAMFAKKPLDAYLARAWNALHRDRRDLVVYPAMSPRTR